MDGWMERKKERWEDGKEKDGWLDGRKEITRNASSRLQPA
jgi:hypothetical protein